MDNSFRSSAARSTEYDCIGLCGPRHGPKLQKTKKTRGDDAGKTGTALLANLEHVFRVPRHPVRIRAPERECQPHLPVAWCLDRRPASALARGTGDRTPGPTRHRLHERPDLGPTWPPQAVFPLRRDSLDAGAARDAEQPLALGSSRDPVDPRCIHQHHDGAISRARGRHAAQSAARLRLRAAEPLHRSRCRHRLGTAMAPRQLGGREQRGGGRRTS